MSAALADQALFDFCGATPIDVRWPVCSQPAGHAGDHMSADFHWKGGERARPKSSERARWPG